MIRYRQMEKGDTVQVGRLFRTCFSHPWEEEAIGGMSAAGGYLSLVAENEKDEILGYVGMRSVCDEADITNVAVRPDARRSGIAHDLVRLLLEEAGCRGIRSVFLEVRASNAPAITLYGHAGFEECGRRKDYYTEPGEDAILMVWTCPESGAGIPDEP